MAIGTMAAIGLGAGALSSVLGGRSQNKAAGKAADAQLQVARENNALAREMVGPYAQRGNLAAGNYNALLGIGTPEDIAGAQQGFDTYRGSTGYDFRLGEGMRAITGGAASRGLLRSGATLKALNSYGQNLASDEFGNYLGYLGNQQAIGANAAAGLVNNISGNNQNAADARSNAALVKGQNNPFANALGVIGGGLFGMGG